MQVGSAARILVASLVMASTGQAATAHASEDPADRTSGAGPEIFDGSPAAEERLYVCGNPPDPFGLVMTVFCVTGWLIDTVNTAYELACNVHRMTTSDPCPI